MLQKISLGIITGAGIGMIITSMFLDETKTLVNLFLTKITATSIISGLVCGVIASEIKSKLNTFFICIIAGAIVFYLKYLITGHDFDPITMGLFVGAILGGIFVLYRKISLSIKKYKRLKKLRRRGFKIYG
jgi:uncharacterized membrane protein YeaQ/YmgE (transglycosylase-associated protein family)